ncbi:hypothetical protein BCR41DRAFT_423329 [Lobosporangium transversale]|uniref:Uncharacterized protein n=1 Tax=Lobosporangium transversale TaxID=64571 RepID=A0A1Y2GIV3_9FUNG|nr:hypothetical protein BCR41DRAFT_423329 [Lobosporangium transversale]ORZ12143.1 hypothetical protein BCR41DRAFT_423329 [Lobosporangium transversale]|eukprot:XP_021880008.1 hypothetical protein BCR41DRAFT_423329 [Lobosporangium transversale]
MATEDEPRSSLTFPGLASLREGITSRALESEINSLQETTVDRSRATGNDLEAPQGDDDNISVSRGPKQEQQRRRRPLSLASAALPFILTILTFYIYYIYVVHVCTLYLIAFSIFVMLYSISYALSIYCGPGSPLKYFYQSHQCPMQPPIRATPPPIPPTTTPYQPQPSFPAPSHSERDERTASGLSVPAPSITQPSTFKRSREPLNSAGPSPHLLPITMTSKYSTASAIPARNTHSDSSIPVMLRERHADASTDVGDFIPEPLYGSSDRNEGRPIGGIGRGNCTNVDISDVVTRSCQPTQRDNLMSPIATLSICKQDGRPR